MLNAVTFPAIPDMKDARSAVRPSPSMPGRESSARASPGWSGRSRDRRPLSTVGPSAASLAGSAPPGPASWRARGDHPGQDDEEREEHLGHAPRSAACAARRTSSRRHRALDDQEVGAPVAEGEHEAQPHRQPEPLDPHRVAAASPGACHVWVYAPEAARARPPPSPPASPRGRPIRRRRQAQVHQRDEAEHDQEELQHLVVDGAGEPAQET